MPGPSSSTASTIWSPSRATVASTAVAGSVWRSAFSIRLSTRRCSSSRAPMTSRRRRRRPASSWSPATGSSSPAASATTSERSIGSWRAIAPGVGAGEQQEVGDQPAHAARGAQGRGRRLALLALERLLEQLEVRQHGGQRRAQLVRGVGHELPLAREGRLGLAAGGVERAQHALERARELADLVVGFGRGIATDVSPVRSTRRAASVSSVIGAIARRAVARPASSASAVPPRTPRPRKTLDAPRGRLARRTSRRAYWTSSWPGGRERASAPRSRVSTR